MIKCKEVSKNQGQVSKSYKNHTSRQSPGEAHQYNVGGNVLTVWGVRTYTNGRDHLFLNSWDHLCLLPNPYISLASPVSPPSHYSTKIHYTSFGWKDTQYLASVECFPPPDCSLIWLRKKHLPGQFLSWCTAELLETMDMSLTVSCHLYPIMQKE